MRQYSAKRKILLVDDDEATHILIRGILEGANINIIESWCGMEAHSLFRKYSRETDLILLDIKLPDCNGWELIRQFRSENYIKPIIAISAMNPKELKEKARCFGFNSYLSKPFDIKDLKKIVEFYLKRWPIFT